MGDMSDEGGMYDDEELVAAAPGRKDWRGIFIALMVISVVCGLIVIAVVMMTPPDEGPRVKGQRLTWEDLDSGQFKPRTFNGTWLPDSQLLFKDAQGNLKILDAASGRTKIVSPNKTLLTPKTVSYSLSGDKRYVIVTEETRKRPGFSSQLELTIHDLTTGEQRILNPLTQAAVWSPQGHALVFVIQGDLYYLPDPLSTQSVRLTWSGQDKAVTNGIPDWSYRDVFPEHAIWFSPTGTKLAFASFNDTLVPELQLPVYGEVTPTLLNYRYPTAESDIPAVSIWVVDLADLGDEPKLARLTPPFILLNESFYLSWAGWVRPNTVAVQCTNRSFNLSVISMCEEAGAWSCVPIHTVDNVVNKGWVSPQTPLFAPQANAFLSIQPMRDGPRGLYPQIVFSDLDRRRTFALTHSLHVHKLLSWDTKRHLVYFLASPLSKPGEQHLYRVASIRSETNQPVCLSCAFPARPESQSSHPTCQFSNAHFSPNQDYFVHECLGLDVPYTTLRSALTNSVELVLEDNADLVHALKEKAFPKAIFLNYTLGGGNTASRTVFVKLVLPPGLLEDELLDYPLIIQALTRPGSQQVTYEWQFDMGTVLASSNGFLYGYIDGVGSEGYGYSTLHAIQTKPGIGEGLDYVEAIKGLKSLPYVSPVKIALYGKGYGGFGAALTLARDNDALLGCAIVQDPIVSWTSIEAKVAEQVLGPLRARGGYRLYNEADLTSWAPNLVSKSMMLVHGSLNQEIPPYQAMALSSSLMKSGVLFKQLVYPDEDGTLRGVRMHAYKSMQRFLQHCFDQREIPEVDNELKKDGGE